MVGHEVVREPEWDRRQLALMRAHLRNRKTPRHGIPIEVATDPANQFGFVTEGPFRDWAETTLADARDAYFKQYDKPGAPVQRAGLMWRVKLRDTPRPTSP